jgi:hypothetical protein
MAGTTTECTGDIVLPERDTFDMPQIATLKIKLSNSTKKLIQDCLSPAISSN